MLCPNCGHDPASLKLTPSLALRLALFAYGLLCWVVLLISAAQSSGVRGVAPLTPPAPPTGLMANPIVMMALYAGAVVFFAMVIWESITMLRARRERRCEACGHTW